MSDSGLVDWLRSTLDELERVARQMLDNQWPAEVWVAPYDSLQHDDPGSQGSIAVTQLAPKAYRRLWQNGSADDGWVVREDAVEVWSEDVARSVLARVEADKRVIELHQPDAPGRFEVAFGLDRGRSCTRCEVPLPPGTAGAEPETWPCLTLRWLAYGHRYDADGFDPAWAPEGVETA